MARIDAAGMHYKALNEMIKKMAESGEKEIVVDNVCGHKFIGDGLKSKVRIILNGVPGNDLASFMDGPEVHVNANGQDGIGNTMNSGKVVVHGHAGDVIGYAMRGGRIFIKGDVGYRVGIHMKSYKDNVPYIVIGGTASNFFAEYMAGGVMLLLGLTEHDGRPIAGDYVGTGMHGGAIYVRGDIDDYYLGREVSKVQPGPEDVKVIESLVKEYCSYFGCDPREIMSKPFIKLTPKSYRPYGNMYTH